MLVAHAVMSGGGGAPGSSSMGPGAKIRDGSFSFNHPEPDAAVVETHEADRTLIYTHEIAGPGGKQDSREIVFDV